MATMSEPLIHAGDAEAKDVDSAAEAEAELQRALVDKTDLETGLSEADVELARKKYGFNELPEKHVNPFLLFLGYFWGPMPCMIWLAIIVEAISGDWPDFGVLMVLQVLNGTVGYIEEKNAGNAIAALKQSLAPECRVMRNGTWRSIKSRLLVPGDLIELVIGDIVPADCILFSEEPIQVDQAALTGESLPVSLPPGGKAKMGSAVKRGECNAVVCATGRNTFFGKAAGLIDEVEATGRFQQVLFRVTSVLLILSLVLCSIIFVTLIVRDEGALDALATVVVLLVASIPIAMQVVCTSTMAVGSRRLAQRKVIVARLSAIEELAGMTILCSDKTGTLTQNKLGLREPLLMGDMNEEELIFYSALAAKRAEGNQDAIDFCLTNAVKNKGKLKEFKEIKFVPFNPTDKRTESTVEAPDGSIFKVTKGAPQVVLGLAHNTEEISDRVSGAVQSLADRGFRALGVAISYTGVDEEPHWQFQGVLALFDPPRLDTKETIEHAIDMGVEVKMITGDQTAIAKETCRELGMGTNILDTHVLDNTDAKQDLTDICLRSNGFAEVLPEHKFQVVQIIREAGNVTGMTGDGVNDAPALKRADIGIAVEGSTDAAKAAADIVLVEPGLSVIIEAIRRSRKIFQRMRNYSIYRIACTIQLLFFFFFTVLAIQPSKFIANDQGTGNTDIQRLLRALKYGYPDSFTLPVIALVIITILNDGTIITIAHDKVIPDRRPQKWDLKIVVAVASVLGLVATMSSMLILVAALQASPLTYVARNDPSQGDAPWYVTLLGRTNCLGLPVGAFGDADKTDVCLSFGEIRTLMYLKISLSDFLTVFAARTKGFFWERRPGYALLIAFITATSISSILSLEWFLPAEKADKIDWNKNADEKFDSDIQVTVQDAVNMTKITGGTVGAVWIYCLAWAFLQDLAKVLTYYVIAVVHLQESEKEYEARQREMKIANAIDTDVRAARTRGLSRAGSTMLRTPSTASVGGAAAGDLEGVKARIRKIESQLSKVDRLEEELEALRKVVMSADE